MSKETFEQEVRGDRHGWHYHRRGFFIGRVVIFVLIILLIIGWFSFDHYNRYGRYGYGPYMMQGYGYPYGGMMGGWNGGYGMMGGWNGGYGMMGGWNNFQGTNQIFGVISKIDGNNITIMDNGNKEQQIVSQSNTSIISSTGETGLKVLQVGQSISAVGTMKDNVLQAQVIRITSL